MQNFNVIWQAIDTDGDGKLDYSEFLRGVIGEMSEYRKALVRKVINKKSWISQHYLDQGSATFGSFTQILWLPWHANL